MMKNNLKESIDCLTPEALDEALNSVSDVSLPQGVSEDRIKERVRALTGSEQSGRKVRSKLLRPFAGKRIVPVVAACLILVLSVAVFLPMLKKDDPLPDNTLKCFTLGVGSGIEFQVADNGTVTSVKMADDGATDSFDLASMEGKDVGLSLRGVLKMCEEKGCLDQEEVVQLTFDKEFVEDNGEKEDIVQTAELFFYENGMNPKIVVGQITDDSDDPNVTEHIGLGNTKQIIAADLGYPSDIYNTSAELISDENGTVFYHLYVKTGESIYEYTVDAVTGEIVGKEERSDTVPDEHQIPDEPRFDDRITPEYTTVR